jgi:hypothetical protein
MTEKSKKTAALSGSLLVRDRNDSASGFVLSPAPATAETKGRPKASEAREPANDAANDAKDKTVAAESAVDDFEDTAGVPAPADPADEATPQHFLALLRQGNLADAEAAFGRLTGLGPARVQRALYGPGGRNLAIACRALGIEQLQFVSIFILTRKLGPDLSAINAYKLTETVNYFLDTSEETARRVLKQWQYESVEVFGHHQSTN